MDKMINRLVSSRFSLLSAATLLLAGGCDTAGDLPTSVSGKHEEQAGIKGQMIGSADTERYCKGADISWLTEMEALGYKFYYQDGTEGDCVEILSSMGVNACRLRVWVDPENGWCAMDDVVTKAKRAADQGMDIMIDFHYSDVWADPSSQTVPASWSGYDIDGLCQAVSDFTIQSLRQLKENGIEPRWVQIGNETGNGMLWPYGQADKNPEGYARLTTAGIDAVHEVVPQAKTIVHLQSGEDSELAKWLLGILKKYNVDYDIAGFSLYPSFDDYQEYVAKAKSNMQNVVNTFDKDVMLCEVGMQFNYFNQCYDFLNLCFALENEISDSRFKGVLYWEPECYKNFNGYNKGAFLMNGRPSHAMDAFSYSSSGIRPVYAD